MTTELRTGFAHKMESAAGGRELAALLGGPFCFASSIHSFAKQ